MTEKEKNLTETFLEAMEREGFAASLEIKEGPNYDLAEREFETQIAITLSKRCKNTESHRALRETAVSFVSDRLDILQTSSAKINGV
jgi:hypothetical protein